MINYVNQWLKHIQDSEYYGLNNHIEFSKLFLGSRLTFQQLIIL
jgi:hypothetical protein